MRLKHARPHLVELREEILNIVAQRCDVLFIGLGKTFLVGKANKPQGIIDHVQAESDLGFRDCCLRG